MDPFHTGILAQYLWWHDWDECVRGIRCMLRLLWELHRLIYYGEATLVVFHTAIVFLLQRDTQAITLINPHY